VPLQYTQPMLSTDGTWLDHQTQKVLHQDQLTPMRQLHLRERGWSEGAVIGYNECWEGAEPVLQ